MNKEEYQKLRTSDAGIKAMHNLQMGNHDESLSETEKVLMIQSIIHDPGGEVRERLMCYANRVTWNPASSGDDGHKTEAEIIEAYEMKAIQGSSTRGFNGRYKFNVIINKKRRPAAAERMKKRTLVFGGYLGPYLVYLFKVKGEHCPKIIKKIKDKPAPEIFLDDFIDIPVCKIQAFINWNTLSKGMLFEDLDHDELWNTKFFEWLKSIEVKNPLAINPSSITIKTPTGKQRSPERCIDIIQEADDKAPDITWKQHEINTGVPKSSTSTYIKKGIPFFEAKIAKRIANGGW